MRVRKFDFEGKTCEQIIDMIRDLEEELHERISIKLLREKINKIKTYDEWVEATKDKYFTRFDNYDYLNHYDNLYTEILIQLEDMEQDGEISYGDFHKIKDTFGS